MVKEKLINEVLARLDADTKAGKWNGGEPDPSRTAVTRVLYALASLGYRVQGEVVIEPEPPMPTLNPVYWSGANNNAACAAVPFMGAQVVTLQPQVWDPATLFFGVK